jgi:hypothetical protein
MGAAAGSYAYIQSQQQKAAAAKAAAAALAAKNKAAAAKAAASAAAAAAAARKVTASPNPHNIQFNLPPISQSLPLNVNYGADVGQGSATRHDAGRRAAMWFFSQSGSAQTAPKGSSKSSAVAANGDSNYQYGFQWLWNPVSLGTSVSMNSSVIPSAQDATANQAGLFVGLEQVTVSARINRVNDMAMIRGKATNLEQYYGDTYPTSGAAKETIASQISMLEQKGTMADLEYIYRMSNGLKDGNGKIQTNALGIQTADTAFLSPTAVVLRIGKGPLVYVGWLETMIVAHTMFTWDMIPIDTTIDFTINTFATTTLGA